MGPRKRAEFNELGILDRQLKLFEVTVEYSTDLTSPAFQDTSADLTVFRYGYSESLDGSNEKGVGALQMGFASTSPTFHLHAHPLTSEALKGENAVVRVDLDVFSFAPVSGMISSSSPGHLEEEGLSDVFREDTIGDIKRAFAFRSDETGLLSMDNIHASAVLLGSALQKVWQSTMLDKKIPEPESIFKKIEELFDHPSDNQRLYIDLWDVIGASSSFRKFYKRSENHTVWAGITQLLEKIESKKKAVRLIGDSMRVDQATAQMYLEHDTKQAHEIKDSYRKIGKNGKA